MILKAEEKHIEQIIMLWNKAFGDEIESVKIYLDTLLRYVFVYEDKGVVKGMLAVLPVTLKDKKGGYIYAVTTDENYRGQGICKALIDYVKRNHDYDFLVLVPQNEGLYSLYAKMGFKRATASQKKEIHITDSIKYKICIDELTACEYESMRNSYFAGNNIIKWGNEILYFAQKMYNGNFYKVMDEEGKEGYAFLFKSKDMLVIKELLSETPDKIAMCLGYNFGVKKVVYSFPNKNEKPDYMIYGEQDKDLYFGIYLD